MLPGRKLSKTHFRLMWPKYSLFLLLIHEDDENENIFTIGFYSRSPYKVLFITVNFLNIRTPKKFVVFTLKFELCGSSIE